MQPTKELESILEVGEEFVAVVINDGNTQEVSVLDEGRFLTRRAHIQHVRDAIGLKGKQNSQCITSANNQESRVLT